jgi:hypothetical protein
VAWVVRLVEVVLVARVAVVTRVAWVVGVASQGGQKNGWFNASFTNFS